MPTLEPRFAGLTKTGQPSARADALDDLGVERIVDAMVHHQRARDRDSRIAQHRLAERLVHARGRAQHAGADIGQADRLEHALDRAVLAEGAVQHREHDVDLPRRAAVHAHERPAPGAGDERRAATGRELRRRHTARSGLERRRTVDDLPAAGVIDQERDDVELLRIESLDDRARRGQGDRVLRRAPAGDDGNAHAPGHGVCVVSVVADWGSLPTVSVTTNGLVFVPSMS